MTLTQTLTTGDNDANTTFSGVATGAGGFTKIGTGEFTLSGANTYTGTTTIQEGILEADAAGRGQLWRPGRRRHHHLHRRHPALHGEQ